MSQKAYSPFGNITRSARNLVEHRPFTPMVTAWKHAAPRMWKAGCRGFESRRAHFAKKISHTCGGIKLIDSTQLGLELEKYESCWFEIKTIEKSIITRNREKFLKRSETMSRLEEVRLYKLEKGSAGLRKSRIPVVRIER